MSLTDTRASEERTPGFHWFSERVTDCLVLPSHDALTVLQRLIEEADADKHAGYGPPQDDINKARRKWLDLYQQVYGPWEIDDVN